MELFSRFYQEFIIEEYMKNNLKKWLRNMEDFRNQLKEIYSDNDV